MLAVLRHSGAEMQVSACCYGYTDRAPMLMLNRCVYHVQLLSSAFRHASIFLLAHIRLIQI